MSASRTKSRAGRWGRWAFPVVLALVPVWCAAAEPSNPELRVEAGMLSFQRERLANVIREINRHHHCRLIITDPYVAKLRVGGQLRVDDLEAVMRRLQSALSLTADQIVPGNKRCADVKLSLARAP